MGRTAPTATLLDEYEHQPRHPATPAAPADLPCTRYAPSARLRPATSSSDTTRPEYRSPSSTATPASRARDTVPAQTTASGRRVSAGVYAEAGRCLRGHRSSTAGRRPGLAYLGERRRLLICIDYVYYR